MSGILLAIDPGSSESAFSLIETDTCRPLAHEKIGNAEMLRRLRAGELAGTPVGIEMIASYGMAVGKEVFETCVWIGRFQEACGLGNTVRFYRRDIKLHHCHSSKATDANVSQALIDRFAYGERNRGKGTKDSPGWFHGFAKDIWQAYALAVYMADTNSRAGVRA